MLPYQNVQAQEPQLVPAVKMPSFLSDFTKKYQITHLLGQGIQILLIKGASSRVFGGFRKKDSFPIALKLLSLKTVSSDRLILDPSFQPPVRLPLEVYIIKRLSHSGIIQLLDFYVDKENYYVVMESFGSGWDTATVHRLHIETLKHTLASSPQVPVLQTFAPMDLFECIDRKGSFPEILALKVFHQLLNVLWYLRHMHVFHMDLKDENIIIDTEFRIKLIDFGSAMILAPKNGHYPKLTKFVGTLKYAPPEVIRGKAYCPAEAESWCLGVILYTMLFGYFPFQTSEDILYGRLQPMRFPTSQKLMSLFSGLLNLESDKRWSLERVFMHLNLTPA